MLKCFLMPLNPDQKARAGRVLIGFLRKKHNLSPISAAAIVNSVTKRSSTLLDMVSACSFQIRIGD